MNNKNNENLLANKLSTNPEICQALRSADWDTVLQAVEIIKLETLLPSEWEFEKILTNPGRDDLKTIAKYAEEFVAEVKPEPYSVLLHLKKTIMDKAKVFGFIQLIYPIIPIIVNYLSTEILPISRAVGKFNKSNQSEVDLKELLSVAKDVLKEKSTERETEQKTEATGFTLHPGNNMEN